MRAAVEPLAAWISTTPLQLKTGTITSKYSRVLLAFLISGLVHITINMEFGIPFLSSPAPRFFLMQALGIMFEEAAERVWRSYAPYSPFDIGPNGYEKRRRWAKLVGYCWVWGFFVWTVPSFSWAELRIAGTRSELALPWSFVERLGLKGSVSLNGM
jgi:Membrane bound O-acyl transferase family